MHHVLRLVGDIVELWCIKKLLFLKSVNVCVYIVMAGIYINDRHYSIANITTFNTIIACLRVLIQTSGWYEREKDHWTACPILTLLFLECGYIIWHYTHTRASGNGLSVLVAIKKAIGHAVVSWTKAHARVCVYIDGTLKKSHIWDCFQIFDAIHFQITNPPWSLNDAFSVKAVKYLTVCRPASVLTCVPIYLRTYLRSIPYADPSIQFCA